MISSFVLAAQQLPDPALRGAVVKGVAAAIAFFIAIAVVVTWGVGELSVYVTTSEGWVITFLDPVLTLAGWASILVLIFFLFPIVAISLTSLFLDPVIAAVERKHYPHLPEPRAVSLQEGLSQALAFLGISILVNLVALPFYLIPGLNVVLFYLVNGYLAGREYFELVGTRRKKTKALRQLRKKRSGRLIGGGIFVTFLMTIPIVNLFAPVIGAAGFVHLLAQDMAEDEADS